MPSLALVLEMQHLTRVAKSEPNIHDALAGHGVGLLVDSLSDPTRSAKADLPVYRVAGGAGYFYSASFEPGGRGHRRYVAIDVSQPAIQKFEPALHDEIVYVLVLLKHGAEKPAAQRLFNFLQSPAAEAVYDKAGFSRFIREEQNQSPGSTDK